MPATADNYIRAFSTLGCADLQLDEVLAVAKRHEIEAVELRALGDSIDLVRYFTENYRTPEALAAHVAESGVRVVALNASSKVIGITGSGREELIALAPWAHALGGAHIRVFDGGDKLDATEMASGAEMLTWWNRQRVDQGWSCNVMIEPHDTLITSDRILRFLESVPTGTAILWDALHTWNLGGESPSKTWNLIRDFVVHIHVKDAVPGGDMMSTKHTLPGKGKFPMTELRSLLRDSDYRGAISLEWARKWHTYLPSIDEALLSARQNHWW